MHKSNYSLQKNTIEKIERHSKTLLSERVLSQRQCATSSAILNVFYLVNVVKSAFLVFFIGMNVLRICIKNFKNFKIVFKSLNCCLRSKIAHENSKEWLNDYLFYRYMCSVCEEQSQESVRL